MNVREESWRVWSDAVAAGVRGVPDSTLAHAAELLGSSSIVLTAGNGGSHALATHAAQALLKPSYAAGGGRQTVCLTDSISALSAHANDGGWAGALEELARPFIEMAPRTGPHRAMLWLFSSSGKSENLVRVARLATAAGLRLIAFTGFDGEPLRSMATISVHVDSRDYEVVEPVHDALLHRVQYHLRVR